MKTKMKQDKPVSFPSLSEKEMTPVSIAGTLYECYNQGYNHAIEIVLMAKGLGLSDEEIIKRYKK